MTDTTETPAELDRDTPCPRSMSGGAHSPLVVTDPDEPTRCGYCDVVLAPPERDMSFSRTSDAMAWAKAFCARLRAGVFTDGVDEGLMVGWFANAMAAQEQELRRGLPHVSADLTEGQPLILAPLTGVACELDLVPLPEPCLLVLRTHEIDGPDVNYVAASLQQLVERLAPNARAALVLDQDDQTIESLDVGALRTIGLQFIVDE